MNNCFFNNEKCTAVFNSAISITRKLNILTVENFTDLEDYEDVIISKNIR